MILQQHTNLQSTLRTKKPPISWLVLVNLEAQRWGHKIYKVTGNLPTRRSIVLWGCLQHPKSGLHTFTKEDLKLKSFLEKQLLLHSDFQELLEAYPQEFFYASRMDEYLKRFSPKQSRT